MLGLLDRAGQANRSSLSLEPEFILAIVSQAHVDLFQGEAAAATKAVKQLADNHDSNPYALQSAGWILIFAGQPEQAKVPLERAYMLSPDASGEGYVRVLLGYTQRQSGERERAIKFLEVVGLSAVDE